MRVLIAHAHEAARSSLADALDLGRTRSLDILTATEGPEALEILLQDDPPEVALVDWDLPEVEGPEMCRLVRDFHQGRDTWLVVLASPAHSDTGDAWRAGADACVSTPASASALRDCVVKGLRERARAHLKLDSVRRPEDEVIEDVRLSVDLKATLDAEDPVVSGRLDPGPAELTAQRVEADDPDGKPHARATLEAVLMRT